MAGPNAGWEGQIGTSRSSAPGRTLDVFVGSNLDHALNQYQNEPRLRQLIGLLAFFALAALTGIGLLLDPGPISWLLAVLAVLAGAECASASLLLRRQRQETARDTGSPGF